MTSIGPLIFFGGVGKERCLVCSSLLGVQIAVPEKERRRHLCAAPFHAKMSESIRILESTLPGLLEHCKRKSLRVERY